MIETTTHKSKITISKRIRADRREIGKAHDKTVIAYRVLVESTVFCNGEEVSFNRTPLEGVAWDEDLQDFLHGRPNGISGTISRTTPVPGKGPDRVRRTTIMLLDAATLDRVRMEGYEAINGAYISPDSTPLTDLEEGKPLTLVEIDTGHNRVFDALTGEVMPYSIVFNYIDGWIHNGNYDLLSAATTLLKRDDVTLAPSGGEQHTRYWDDRTEDEPRYWVGRIPGYNCSEGQTECLRFHWHPSTEDIHKVFALAKSWIQEGKDPEPSKGHVCQAIFELDMLGLQASETDTRRAERLLHAEERGNA